MHRPTTTSPVAPVTSLDALLEQLADLVAARVAARLPASVPAPASPAERSENEWLDERAAAAYLGVSKKFLQEHRADLPPSRVGRRALRWSRTQLAAYMQRGGRAR